MHDMSLKVTNKRDEMKITISPFIRSYSWSKLQNKRDTMKTTRSKLNHFYFDSRTANVRLGHGYHIKCREQCRR